MDHPTDQNITPHSPPPLETNIAPPRSLFADDAAPLPSPEPPRPRSVARRQSQVLKRIVLPVVALVVGIACLAWVVQYLPNRARPSASTPTNNPDGEPQPVVQFPINVAVWGGDERAADSAGEYEIGVPGHYDFEFINITDGAIELGLAEKSCVCAQVKVALFQTDGQRDEFEKLRKAGGAATKAELTWDKLETDKDLKKFIKVPAKAAGLVRIHWDAKNQPDNVGLVVKVWTRAPDQARGLTPLGVKLSYVAPVSFDNGRVDLGILNAGQKVSGSFLCWSATRDLQIEPASEDPRLQIQVKKVSAEECAQMEKDASGKIYRRVRCAFRVEATLLEQVDGKQTDMGQFLRPAPLKIVSAGETLAVNVPLLRAYVRGDVTLSASEEGGRINFLGKPGTTKKVKVYAPPETKLTFVGCEPAVLDVDVNLAPGKMIGNQREWNLDVTLKPNQDFGPMPDDGVVVLRCEVLDPAKTRIVRIPVTGSVTRN